MQVDKDLAVADSQPSVIPVSIDASCDLEIHRCVTQPRYAGLVVFGLMTAWLIWMLPSERGAVALVTLYGIPDLRIGKEIFSLGVDRGDFG
ncbi:hypothetical protein [Bradyrhizobium agreste]|uniref:hypothetical protein n=1 Tax=Bradyrhizobium agreste TaxID=2751811 RepID=UPI00289E2EB1|nr:hypothetical protein [Bradyrhizobium agreste]